MSAEIQDNLKRTVNILAETIGSRGYLQSEALQQCIDYITSELTGYGYSVSGQPYRARGNIYKNIIAETKGTKQPEKILIIGAHYDTVTRTPGADDNASGVAGLLELARLLKDHSPQKTLRFVAFTLEEPPFFRTKLMGSYVYAKSLYEQRAVVEGMICLEMIGYFTDKKGSQYFPMSALRWFFPERGNFITLVSNLHSKGFLQRVKSAFKNASDLLLESISMPPIVPGIDFSDHGSFWRFGYPAVMITDTGFFRNPNYHASSDVPETLDYEKMEKVVLGAKAAIEEISA